MDSQDLELAPAGPDQAGQPGGSAQLFVNSTRAQWADLPPTVRTGIEELLGTTVTEAINQSGGFSPGLAARVRCADGSRAFVKTVGSPLNPDAPGIYRAEARIAQRLPAQVPVPPLRATYDDGDWVALIFDEIDGRPPQEPWLAAELQRVVHAVTDLSRALTPCPVDDAPQASDELRPEMLAYAEMVTAPPDDLDPWERRHLPQLAELAASALDHLDGDTLAHLDIRTDNILLREDGSDGRRNTDDDGRGDADDEQHVWFVDWPWACQGPTWLDTALLMINAAFHGHDPEPYLLDHPLVSNVNPEHVTAFVAGVCGFFSLGSRQPPPPGLPTLREFQHAQYVTTLDWLRRRTNWA